MKQHRRTLTDSIKEWVKNEPDASKNWANFAYNNVTRAITKACFTNYKGNMPLSKNNFRDKITQDEAYLLTRMELLAADIILNIEKRFPDMSAKEKYYELSKSLSILGEHLGRMHSVTIDEIFTP